MRAFFNKLYGKSESFAQPSLLQQTFQRLAGDFKTQELAQFIKKAYDMALSLEHKVSTDLLETEGMSGRKYRYLINNLIGLINNPRYLEVGSWKGSTACAAMYLNKLKITCIDNWSEFNGPKEIFLNNVRMFSNSNTDFRIIESDFRGVDFNSIGKHNVYLFDGPHLEKDQFDGINLALPALDETFILIVDDWNWPAPRKGTFDALSNSDIAIIASIEVFTCTDIENASNRPYIYFENSDWHNGYLIAVCQKPSTS